MNKELIFIKDFYYTKSDNDIDVSEISPIMRRKLSRLDKHALTTMFKVYSKDAEEIVYASQDGESDRLNTIISQYTGMNEVSPAQFSASVHNYPAGFFTLFKKLNVFPSYLHTILARSHISIIQTIILYNSNKCISF